MRIRETEGCGSKMAQQIVEGLCLGKKSCTLNVSEAITYAWEPNADYGTNCSEAPTIVTIDGIGNITKEVCEVRLNDDSDYSQCDATKSRAFIVYGRCFTTRIDLSTSWSLKIIGWDSMTVSQTRFLHRVDSRFANVCIDSSRSDASFSDWLSGVISRAAWRSLVWSFGFDVRKRRPLTISPKTRSRLWITLCSL